MQTEKVTVPGDPASDSALLTTNVRDSDRGTWGREGRYERGTKEEEKEKERNNQCMYTNSKLGLSLVEKHQHHVKSQSI